MSRTAANSRFNFLIAVAVFLSVSLFMTYNIISMPSIVLGDNFYWTPRTVVDVLGPGTIRESYLGDFGVLSTFKNGFLQPLVYAFSSLSIPTAIVYPFLFYFLSMLSFYSLSSEFLKSKALSITASIIYVVNPVTPYYYASVQNAFALVFLPLTMKFFIRSLRELEKSPAPRTISLNVALSAFFLTLSVSAHEQFLLSAGLIGVFFIATYIFAVFRKNGLSRASIRLSLGAFLTFLSLFFLVNLPLVLSVVSVSKAPFALYFTGRIEDFLETVRYNYSTLNVATLLRFGGDSGVGLGQTSWYDGGSLVNLLGYSVFAVFVVSVTLLVLNRKTEPDRKFFVMNVALFMTAFMLLFLVKQLPENRSLAERLFNFTLQTWQNPIKLRIVLLLSALTVTLITIRRLENGKFRIAKWAVIALLIFSVIGYNNPWLIELAGSTPIQQISETQNWGSLFDHRYSVVADLLEQNVTKVRGVTLPYTSKTQLYMPPNFRLFQLISGINREIMKLTNGPQVPWSKILGLVSAKSVVLDESYDPNEIPIFPISFGKNISEIASEILEDPGISIQENIDNKLIILDNQNALPLLYATDYYVFYDETSTLKYALRLVDMNDMPAFFKFESQAGRITLPAVVNEGTYEIYAISPKGSSTSKNLQLLLQSSDGTSLLNLNETAVFDDVNIHSTSCKLLAGDAISSPNNEKWDNSLEIKELTLNSTSYSLGTYDSFKINTTLSILQKGEYSHLGPRIVIDTGSEQYYLIFHDYGAIELAMLKGPTWTPGLIYRYTGFDMLSNNSSVDICVTRVFDEVQILLNGYVEMSFPISTSKVTVYLSSEQSTSKFTNTSTQNSQQTRLFAARQTKTQLSFTVQQIDQEVGKLTVSNTTNDYAVVCQYLDTSLRVIKTDLQSYPVATNIFFTGWILHSEGLGKTTTIEIGIENAQLTMGLTLLSIVSTYLIFIIALQPLRSKRLYSILVRQINNLISAGRRGAETHE